MTTRAADPAVREFVAAFSARLRRAIGDRSFRSVASASGMTHSAVARLVRGQTVPDVVTIWRLERTLDTDLWPAEESRRSRADAIQPPLSE